MPPETRDIRAVDDADRELDKLRRFGGALVLGLALVAALVAVVTVVVWWAVF
jgi:hypothetical protein